MDTRKGDRHRLKGDRGRVRIRDRSNRDRSNRPSRAKQGTNRVRLFLAVDGEGWGVDDLGRQHYQVMVAANRGECYRKDTGQPLTTHQCFDWLHRLPKDRILVAFSYGYDVSQMLRDLPPEKLLDLHQRSARMLPNGQARWVYWEGWLLDYLPRKQLLLTRYGPDGKREKATVVWDCYGFFGKRFSDVLEEWQALTVEERKLVAEGKARRTEEAHDRDEEARYSRLECIGLAEIMTRLSTLCSEVGYPLTSYFGAGSIAGAMLSAWKIRDHVGSYKGQLLEAIATAYFGGRFETALYGELPLVYCYDINQAYPNIIRALPCMAHGRWVRSKAVTPTSLLRVAWDTTADLGTDPATSRMALAYGPFPVRASDGSITFPMKGKGWYWGSEVAAARRHYKGLRVLSGWRWVQECDHVPFARVPEVCAERKARKAVGDPGQIPLKLGVNSLYGKTAQAVGTARYHDYAWAGMITAGTRAMLLDAIAQAPDQIVGTATDSVSSRVPLDLPVSDDLGDWEYSEQKDVLVVQNGVQSQFAGEMKARTRGMHREEVPWDLLRAAWRAEGPGGSVSMSRTRYAGLAVAMLRRKPELMGRWITEDWTLTFGDPVKRKMLEPHREAGGVWFDSIPVYGGGTSVPYRKLISAELDETIAFALDQEE